MRATTTLGTAIWMGAIGLLATGCVRVEKGFSDTVSADGVFFVEGTTDRGDLIYDGGAISSEFTVTGRSWASGGNKGRVEDREATNNYQVSVIGDLFRAGANSFDSRAGVDFEVLGPPLMHVDLLSERGTAELYDVDGTHVVTASRITGRGIVGDVDFFADGSGIDVEVFPYDRGLVLITARGGDATVFLPAALDYDLTIIGDPEYEIVVEELGWDTLVLEPGLAIGQRGSRSIRVDIDVTGGSVQVLSAR